jgi:hypothetical protein
LDGGSQFPANSSCRYFPSENHSDYHYCCMHFWIIDSPWNPWYGQILLLKSKLNQNSVVLLQLLLQSRLAYCLHCNLYAFRNWITRAALFCCLQLLSFLFSLPRPYISLDMCTGGGPQLHQCNSICCCFCFHSLISLCHPCCQMSLLLNTSWS